MNFLIDDAPALVVVLPLIVSAIIAFMPSSRWPWIISMITLVVHLLFLLNFFQWFKYLE